MPPLRPATHVTSQIDLEDITSDPLVIERISWAERRQCP